MRSASTSSWRCSVGSPASGWWSRGVHRWACAWNGSSDPSTRRGTWNSSEKSMTRSCATCTPRAADSSRRPKTKTLGSDLWRRWRPGRRSSRSMKADTGRAWSIERQDGCGPQPPNAWRPAWRKRHRTPSRRCGEPARRGRASSMSAYSSTACASCSNPWLERRAPADPLRLVRRRLRAPHHDFLAGVGMHADQEVFGHPKQSVEDRRLDHRIIEAIPAGLVDRHACVEEKMEPTGRTNVYDLKASALRARDEIPWTENMEMAGRFERGPRRAEHRMPPAPRIRPEDVQDPIRFQRATGRGEERDWLEDVLDDVTRRDDIERVGGQRRGLDRALDDVEAVRAGEGRGFRIGLETLHRPAQVSHDSQEVTVPASDIEEATARRTRHGMDDLFALLPYRRDEPQRLAEEPLRRIVRESPVAVRFEHAPPAARPEPVSLEGGPALHAVRVIRRVQPPDLPAHGA